MKQSKPNQLLYLQRTTFWILALQQVFLEVQLVEHLGELSDKTVHSTSAGLPDQGTVAIKHVMVSPP